jgi:hypothetical protein
MEAHTKKEEITKIGGGKNNKKGKKPKDHQTADKGGFNIDFAVINKFGLVMVSPPVQPSDLEGKISELTLKKEKYLKEGEAELLQEKDDLMSKVEKEVEAEIEREALAAEEEEKMGGEEVYERKQSYEEEKLASDEAYFKPRRGGGQQVNAGKKPAKRGLILNDEDFPALE